MTKLKGKVINMEEMDNVAGGVDLRCKPDQSEAIGEVMTWRPGWPLPRKPEGPVTMKPVIPKGGNKK